AALHVEREHERVAELEPARRIGPGRRADDDAVGTGVEQRASVVEAADAARRLDGHAGGTAYLAHQLRSNCAGARPVEIDKVDATRAGGHELARGLRRSGAPFDDLVEVALPEAHGVLAEHVDRRYHFDRAVEPHAAMLTC